MMKPRTSWYIAAGALLIAGCSDGGLTPRAVQLAFIEQPTNTTAGVAINPVIAVAIEDVSGNTVTDATEVVRLAIGTNPGQAGLAGAPSVAAVKGVAVFPNVRISKAATGYTLTATASGLAGATSAPFNISAGSATKLVFSTQPTNTMAGVAIPPVLVIAQDSLGNTDPAFEAGVTVALGENPGGATLTGPTTVAAVAGVATFSGLSIDKASAGYNLTASSGGLTSATSASFAIVRPTAALRITATTTGSVLDPDGYAACVDPASDGHGGTSCAYGGPLVLQVNGALTVTVDTGAHAVLLIGVAASCAVAGDNPRLVHLALGGTAEASFAVGCGAPSLHVTTTTSGGAVDPDGYSLCIDPGSNGNGGTSCAYGGPRAIGANGAVTVTVDTGAHTLLLTGIAANCALTGANPRTAHASQGETVQTPFALSCVPPTLHITVATTGVSPDSDVYDLCVDPYYDYYDSGCSTYAARIGVNSDVLVPVDSGDHVVELDDVAANCAVSGDNPRTVTASGITGVTFTVTCYALGSVRVSTATSGSDVDPDGYRVCIDRSEVPCYWWAQLRANDAYTVNSVFAGSHTLTLTNVGGNCTVSGGTARTVNIPADATVDVGFDVSCSLAERFAYSTVYGQIHVVHSDGTADRSITGGSAPAWSPDGARVTYECGQNICVINADGTGFAQLTADGAGNRHPSWSPDGSKIAFASTSSGTRELFVMSASGAGAVRLTQGVGFLGSPAWSPDGTKIAFDCVVDIGNVDICLVNADGSGFTRLTSDPARDFGAAWKPDGTMLAFTTTRTGGDEIVLMSPAGGNVARIGTGLFGIDPTWSPDGTQLAFVQPGDYEISDAIVVANANGSNVRYVVDGSQPAWKPHR